MLERGGGEGELMDRLRLSIPRYPLHVCPVLGGGVNRSWKTNPWYPAVAHEIGSLDLLRPEILLNRMREETIEMSLFCCAMSMSMSKPVR